MDGEIARTRGRAEHPASDPRPYQIAVLGSLLAYGLVALDLEVVPAIAVAILSTALLTQRLFAELLGLRVDYRSPAISGLSLCLLLRTTSVWVAMLAAFVAIASKFLIRRKGKHVFNPSAVALVAVVLLSDRAWVSPGQWGSPAFFGFLVAGLGMIVVRRAARSDVALAFLAFWAAAVFGRAIWLGDPMAIPARQIESGALLLFAFFMISDPKTTPDSRAGRIVFAGLVALGAGLVQFGLYRPNGPLWALVVMAPAVAWIDRLLPAERYEWGGSPRGLPAGAASRAWSLARWISRSPAMGRTTPCRHAGPPRARAAGAADRLPSARVPTADLPGAGAGVPDPPPGTAVPSRVAVSSAAVPSRPSPTRSPSSNDALPHRPTPERSS